MRHLRYLKLDQGAPLVKQCQRYLSEDCAYAWSEQHAPCMRIHAATLRCMRAACKQSCEDRAACGTVSRRAPPRATSMQPSLCRPCTRGAATAPRSVVARAARWRHVSLRAAAACTVHAAPQQCEADATAPVRPRGPPALHSPASSLENLPSCDMDGV